MSDNVVAFAPRGGRGVKKRRRPRARASLKVDAYMPVWIGDYVADTRHLDVIGHGAYTQLLYHYWRTGPLPTDDDVLARIVSATPEQWASCRGAVRAFFQEHDGRLFHSRVERELKRAKERAEKLQQRARKSATTRWQREKGAAWRDRNECSPTPTPTSLEDHSPSPSGEGVSSAPPPTRAERVIPDCPHEQLIALYHELLPANPLVREWTKARQDYLRARWREMSAPKGKRVGYTTLEDGLAWWRRFFTYVAESRFLTGQVHARDGARPFHADLEWLVRPSNFVKVYEGRYHDRA